MSERRKFIRFNILLKGEFRVEGGAGFSSLLKTINFSREGLKIILPKGDFSQANALTLNVYLPRAERPISIKGGVKWVRSAGNDCELGMKIDKMNPEDKSRILDYAYEIWRKENKR